MRSRYAAYALCLPGYIIQTTHPANPHYHHDVVEWRRQIAEFASSTQFTGLEIVGDQESGSLATVTFVARLFQDQKDLSFTEQSTFEKVRGKWLYRSGLMSQGHAPNLMTQGQLRQLPLAYYGHPILRKVAEPVVKITDDVRKLVDGMVETMDACGGIGLAAPQVHHSVQLFIIRKPTETAAGEVSFGEVKVFINPKLSSPSSETKNLSEGCLSIPTIRAEVSRPKEITVEYLDLSGRALQERVSGWEARVIQHENDHLQGVLFIDHLDKKTRDDLEPLLQNLHNRIHNGGAL